MVAMMHEVCIVSLFDLIESEPRPIVVLKSL